MQRGVAFFQSHQYQSFWFLISVHRHEAITIMIRIITRLLCNPAASSPPLLLQIQDVSTKAHPEFCPALTCEHFP